MINTLTIKQAQLKNGFFTTGSGSKVMLILGSCRVAPLVNYFEMWNNQNGNIYTIHTLDAFNFHWNENDDRVDYEAALIRWETDDRMIAMLKSVDVFIYEFYKNYRMFNCDKDSATGIYSFGLKPTINICIPSYNDIFYLYNDIITFDVEARKMAYQDVMVLGKLSKQTEDFIYEISQRNMQRFYDVCLRSDIPEMAIVFLEFHKKKRFFHTYNHTSKHFTLTIFELLNSKYLHLNLTSEFIEEISQYDMFDSHYTKITEFDQKVLGIEWPEETVSLKDKL